MTSLSWSSVLAWRTERQHLRRRAPPDQALRVTSDIAGLHAQLMSSAELTLWSRIDGLDPGAVQRALWTERTLVKTWAMRGTLHLLPAAELSIFVAAQGALKPRHHVGSWLRYYGLTREQADAMLAAIPEALDGGRLTRDELAREVGRITGIAGIEDRLRSGFGELLKPAAFHGDLCFAPSDGRSVRFARPDQWLGPQEPVAVDEGVAAVTRRYLAAYGPATRERLARWFGMTSPAQAGRWLRDLGDEAAEVRVDGEPAVMLAEDVDAARRARPAGVVRLLPAFDHYVVAAPRDRDAVVPADHAARVFRPQAWLSPVVCVDGRITGTWSHERKGGRLVLQVTPFERPELAVRRAVEEEAAALAAFMGGDPEVGWA
jgi:hypothetical protein